MDIIHTLRFVAFGVVLAFSVITLGISASVDADTFVGEVPGPFGVAVSIITMAVIISVTAIERARKNAISSLVFFELIWVGVLWVLWLASGGVSASVVGCPLTICQAVQAIAAFSFLNFFILLGWFITLLVLSIIGNHWHNSIPETDLRSKRSSTDVPLSQTGHQESSKVAGYQPGVAASDGTPNATLYSGSIQHGYYSPPMAGQVQIPVGEESKKSGTMTV